MLNRTIQVADIHIIYIHTVNDTVNAGYNLGDLLNTPSLRDLWGSSPHASISMLHRMIELGEKYKGSILDYYCCGREDNEIVPNIDRVINAVEKFKNENKQIFEDIGVIVRDPNVCCVHVRNGDLETEDDFIKIINKISHKFDKVICLSGIHMDTRYRDEQQKKTNFIRTMNNILGLNNNIYIYLNTPDVHLSIMSMASNLLVHKGGFSCLGSIVCTGNLFTTTYFRFTSCNNWMSRVNKKYTLLTTSSEIS